MAKDNLTPEDKLLKIIEDPSLAGEKRFGLFRKKAKTETKEAKPKVDDELSIKDKILKKIRIQKIFTLKSINRLLIGVCIAITVFVIAYFYFLQIKSRGRLAEVEKASLDFNIFRESKVRFDSSVEESLSSARKRNIFSFVPPKEEARLGASDDLSDAEIYKLVEGIKLVGIIWSETRAEVMVEDEAEEKTYLLSEGDKLGIIKIKKIYQDRVLIDVDGSELELR